MRAQRRRGSLSALLLHRKMLHIRAENGLGAWGLPAGKFLNLSISITICTHDHFY